jgi:hypothetical protein
MQSVECDRQRERAELPENPVGFHVLAGSQAAEVRSRRGRDSS